VLHVRGIWYANSVLIAQNPIHGMMARSASSARMAPVTYSIFIVYISFFIVQIGYISLDTYPIFNAFISIINFHEKIFTYIHTMAYMYSNTNSTSDTMAILFLSLFMTVSVVIFLC